MTPTAPRARRHRLNTPGLLSLALLLSLSFAAASALSAPPAAANPPEPSPAQTIKLDKKFKGNLPITQLTEDEAILHALNRLAYGPRPGDLDRIRAMGLEKWIDQQLNPASIDDSAFDERLDQYLTLNMSSKALLELFPRPNQVAKAQGLPKEEVEAQMKQERQDAVAQIKPTGDPNIDNAQDQLARMVGPNRIVAELAMAKLDRAIYSNRQLQAVMEDFWFNHFNVYADKGEERWYLTSYVRDAIRPHVLGKFQDLLLATAQSPAMLFYLDNWLSADPQAVALNQQRRQMRRGLFGGDFAGVEQPAPGAFPAPSSFSPQNAAANPAASKKSERGLNENYGREVMELHTVGVDAGYSQQDVIQMARALTGWTIHEPRKDPQFYFDDRLHALGKITVMGRTFDEGGIQDGEAALKFLAANPNTARHISFELARHFVSDDPPPALVARMAKTYESSGGDIRAVLRTMIYSPEFWSRDAYRAKIKTPFELAASTARALDAGVVVSLPLVNWVGRMGEPLFQCQPPTGFSDVAQTWVNAGSLLNRLNFALAFATGHMGGAKVDLASMMGAGASTNPEAALSKSIDLFLGGQIAPGTRQILEARLGDPQILRARLDDPVKQVNEGLISGLVLGSPEFQRR
ncbi:MAG TPA: DUF1800 domain-containing protein [Verrucomicrobiae bacterium]|nr:DUF1800 domain-containing protein [Verrucomicrobiae bacterium]